MAVELALALETRLGLDAPLGEAAGAFSVTELAARILASRLSSEVDSIASDALAARHLEGPERDEVIELLGQSASGISAGVANLAGDVNEPR